MSETDKYISKFYSGAQKTRHNKITKIPQNCNRYAQNMPIYPTKNPPTPIHVRPQAAAPLRTVHSPQSNILRLRTLTAHSAIRARKRLHAHRPANGNATPATE